MKNIKNDKELNEETMEKVSAGNSDSNFVSWGQYGANGELVSGGIIYDPTDDDLAIHWGQYNDNGELVAGGIVYN